MSEFDREELSRKDAAVRVKEQAFVFQDVENFGRAILAIAQLEVARDSHIPFHPLGEPIAVVPEELHEGLATYLREKGIIFKLQKVRSIGELTREERVELRKTGRKVG